jgi:DNA polymerase-3 subunit beta
MNTLVTALKAASKRKDMKLVEINNGKIYATDLDTVVIADTDFQPVGIFDSTQFCALYKTSFDGLNVVDDVYYHNQTPLASASESKLDCVIAGLPECNKRIAALSASQLSTLLVDTDKWMAKHDVRYYLNGLCLTADSKTNRIEVVASNGHTLSINDVEVTAVFNSFVCVINRSSIELLKSLKPTSQVVVYTYDAEDTNRPEWVKFVVDGIEIYAKTYDTKYPDFSRVFTQPFEATVDVNAKECLTQLAGIKPLLSSTKGIVLKSADNGKVAVFIDNAPVCGLSMETTYEFEFGIGYEYLVTLLKRKGVKTLTFARDLSSVTTKVVEGTNIFNNVVMAMRL